MEDIKFENWLIGFVEGEGSFTYRRSDGWPFFTITQNDREILERIKAFFQFGSVRKHCGRADCRAWRYVVCHNWNDLNKLREFFDGRLRMRGKQEQFKFWVSLFDLNHPIRINGRTHERLRSREYNKRCPQKRREAIKRWKKNNREKVIEYRRKWWNNHKEYENLKRREKRRLKQSQNA